MGKRYVQRVHVVVEAGYEGRTEFLVVRDCEDIHPKFHYRTRQGISAAMRRLAGRLPDGFYLGKGETEKWVLQALRENSSRKDT